MIVININKGKIVLIINIYKGINRDGNKEKSNIHDNKNKRKKKP